MKNNSAQKNIPQGWELKRLGDILDYERPDNYIVKNTSYADDRKTPVLTANKSFILGYTDEDFGIYENLPCVIFDDFTTDSKFVDFPFKVKSSAIKILKSKNENTELKFVHERMKLINFPLGNHKRYYISQYQDLEILIPKSKTEQQKIAEILGAVDEDIAKTQDVIEATEKLKKGLMQKLFTRGIGHTKFKKTKLGEIPEEWEVEKIDSHVSHVGSGATPRGGSRVYLTEGVPFIRSQNVYFKGLVQDGLVYISKNTHNEMGRSKVLPKDILLNITGASIGRACIVPNNLLDANVNQHVCIIRPSENLFFKYLFYFLQSKKGQDQIFKFQIGGNREGLNFQQIRTIEFPFSKDIKEQQRIAEILSAVDEKINVNKKLKIKLTKLKKGLMQDLLSGKVRVI